MNISMLSDKDQRELVAHFRYKLNRLEGLRQSTDPNELIEVAGLIRDLFISDKNGLVGEIFRSVPILSTGHGRHKLKFRAVQFASSSHDQAGNIDWFVGDGMVPDTGVPYVRPVRNYSRDDFLKMPVISVNGQVLTNKDIILFSANKLGSRHWDRNRNSQNTNPILFDIHEQFTLGGISPAVRTLMGIADIVAATLHKVDDKLTHGGF